MVHGFASITHRGDQVVSGMALNVIAAGLGPTLADAWFRQAGRVPVTAAGARFAPIDLPFADAARGIPILGPIYADLISGHNALVYLTALLVPLVAWVVYRTRFGLRLRAVGENPAAVDTAGISVEGMRYRALIVTGALCGIAGAYLSIAQSAGFTRDMTAGKGYLALAALIFGKWRPVPALLACLLFAFTDALQARLQGVPLPGVGVVPVQLIQALPYLLTIFLLAGFVGRSVAPKSIGIPYVKER
jgi:simple sugar transport system permease protein